MADSKKAQIMDALAAKLATVTAGNGYDTDVQKVFHNEIPMGLQLDNHELPAVFVIGGDDTVDHKLQWVDGNWEIEVQLLHKDVTDSVMHNFVRDIAKAVFAGSATGTSSSAWRSLHPSITYIHILDVEEDLNMIEANRFFIVKLMLKYKTQPHDL